VRTTGLHRYDRYGENLVAPVVQNTERVEALVELEHNLERLALDIPDVGIDDLPFLYHRHIVGIP